MRESQFDELCGLLRMPFHERYEHSSAVGRDSIVCIMTRYGLAGQDRIPVGAIFSAPAQIDPGTHPASCTMGTRRLSQG